MNPWTPLVAATLGWGASAVLTRGLILRGVDTWTLTPIRMVFALVSLLALIPLYRRFWTTDRLAWRYGSVLGVFGMALPMIFFTLSLEDLPVSLGGLLVALIPLSTVGAAHFLVDGERFPIKALPGLLLALAGSAFLVGIGGLSVSGVDNLWRGVVFSVTGVALAGVGGALSRRYALKTDANQLVLPQFTVNTLVIIAIVIVAFDFDIQAVDGPSWLMLVLVGALGTTVAFGSFLIGAGMNPASRLALTGYSVPVVALGLAVLFLGETLTWSIVVGAVMILAGVVMAEKATKHVPEPGVMTAR